MKIPVAMICFRRPYETAQVLRALSEVRPAKLYVYFDGPRVGRPDDVLAIQKTKLLFSQIAWPCELRFNFASSNLGLSRRVLTALDDLFDREDFAIVLEDDCVPSPSFFRFVEELEPLATKDDGIAMLSGNNFGPSLSQSSFFLSRSAYIWGWALKKRAWVSFRNSNLGSLDPAQLDDSKELLKTFRSVYLRALYARTLRARRNVDSWALYFSAWVRLHGKFAVLPRVNLVENVGFSEDATHTSFLLPDARVRSQELRFPLKYPRRLRYSSTNETVEGWYRIFKILIHSVRNPGYGLKLLAKIPTKHK
jgi:hypothetical protein